MDELTSHLLKAAPDKKYLLVIDDIQYLSDYIFNNIKDIVNALKKSSVYKNIGIVLISNKKIPPITESVASTIYCPRWNEIEIEQLLLLKKIDIQDEIKSYCKLMVSTCGGHPLVALALARKAPKIVDLLLLRPKSLPALYDEELTNEITGILFNDLLKDEDHRDFVLRLSVLIFRFDLALADFVSTNIKPELRTPVKLMFENLKGTVIEGDEQLSYSVAFIFSKIAQEYLTKTQKQEIWDQAGNYIITPKDRIYSADKMIDAIYYSILAQKFEKVFYWTSFLISLISQKPPSREQMKYILDRLSIVETLTFPDNKKLRLPYFMALFSIAAKYAEIDELDKSNAILNKLLRYPIGQDEIPEQVPKSADYINNAARFFYFLNLLKIKDASSALKILNQCDVNLFIEINLSATEDISFLHAAIQQGQANDFPIDFIGEIMRTVSLNDNLLLGELFECFVSLGFKACKEKNRSVLNIILNNENLKYLPLRCMFLNVAYATYELESNNPAECINIIEEILKSISLLKVESNKIMVKIHQMRGDAFFNIRNREKAFKEYNNSLVFITETTKSFDYAWANYRMGICASDIDDSITFFTNASNGFNDIEMLDFKARSDGECAVSHYQKGEIEKAFSIIVDLANGYYLEGIEEYGPAIAIGLATSNRLISELKKELIDESSSPDKVGPKLEREVFAKVLDEVKPEAGICTAYYIISDVFECLNNKEKQIYSLKISFNGEPINEVEQNAKKLLVGLNLIVLLTEQHNAEEAKEIIYNLFNEYKENDFELARVWVYYIFSKNEELLKHGKIPLHDYNTIVDAVEMNVDKLSGTVRYWWLSEIYKRKGGINGVTNEKEYNPDFLSHALEYAIMSNNFEVMIDAGYHIGFRYLSKIKTLKKLAEIHLIVVLGISNDTRDISRLEIVGTNLKNLWSTLRIRKLTVTDLNYFNNLTERSKRVIEKSPDDLHAPLMIIFLLLINHVESDSNYNKALIWAINKIKNDLDKIPSEDYEYIKHLFT